jgi:hypothetical protein
VPEDAPIDAALVALIRPELALEHLVDVVANAEGESHAADETGEVLGAAVVRGVGDEASRHRNRHACRRVGVGLDSLGEVLLELRHCQGVEARCCRTQKGRSDERSRVATHDRDATDAVLNAVEEPNPSAGIRQCEVPDIRERVCRYLAGPLLRCCALSTEGLGADPTEGRLRALRLSLTAGAEHLELFVVRSGLLGARVLGAEGCLRVVEQTVPAWVQLGADEFPG